MSKNLVAPKLVFGLLLIAATTLRADYRIDFRKGIRAYNKRQWAEAADSMRKAIGQNPNESMERIPISGTDYEPYTPHFYLGAALAQLKQCDQARQELAVSQSAGVILKVKASDFKAAIGVCGPAPQVKPPLTASVAPPPAAITETRGSVPLTTTSVATTQPVKPPVTATTPAPPPVTTTTVAQQQPARTPPPQPLADAVRAYARGDYRGALALLAASNTNDRVYKAQIALLRGASRYSQFLAAGGKDPQLKQQVIADVREYRSLDKRPVDPRLFSPRFRDFVANPR